MPASVVRTPRRPVSGRATQPATNATSESAGYRTNGKRTLPRPPSAGPTTNPSDQEPVIHDSVRPMCESGLRSAAIVSAPTHMATAPSPCTNRAATSHP